MSESDVPNSDFELIASLKFNETIPVKKYRSSKTGLNVVFADVKGPIVYGYFAVATEALDDDGLPHTLEHLIFLGSENYRYKGTLDAMANLCLASGTNAWTDTDHTAYTMTTAGSDGFLTLLPAYLDHIFFPTLTDSGFITEVHHVTGEGTDAGVVYCEMQGRETSGEQLTEIEVFRNLYPGKCGYHAETGGIVKNLRTSTNIVKIREYHRKFYRPENCTLIISGHINKDDVFKILAPMDQRIFQEMNGREPFVKPWQSSVPVLTSTVEKEIKYPSDKEDNGLIFRAWQGPSINDQKKLIACTALLQYLTETSASPLIKNLVEIPTQFCSDVSYMTVDNAITAIILVFEDVDLEQIRELNGVVSKVFQEILEGEGPNGFNLERIRTILEKWRLKQMLRMEKNPHADIAKICISDMIYSRAIIETLDKFNPSRLLLHLAEEPKEFWLNLMNEVFVQAPYVSILAYPSEMEYKKHSQEENDRISQRVKTLGPNGLRLKREILNRAIQDNSQMPPNEVLTSIPVPSVDKVAFFSLRSYNTDSEGQHPLFSTKHCPVYMHLDDVDTYFVYLYVILDTAELPAEYRSYLPLFLEYILDADIVRNGKVVPYGQISMEMEQEILNISCSLGVHSNRFGAGQYSNGVLLSFQLEPNKYLDGIRWIREILFQTKLNPSRLTIFANKMIKSVSQYRRDGAAIVNDLMHVMLYKPDTNIDSSTALRMHAFLTKVVSKIESKNEAEINGILNDIEIVRAIITKPENMVIHLACNVEALSRKYINPSVYWADVIPRGVKSKKRPLQIASESEFLLEHGNRLYENCITAIASIDTAFLITVVPTIKDFYHPDLATILVFIQYMTQLEGPMWRTIRGLGLAYHHNLSISLPEGLIYLSLQKSTDVVVAYKKTREIFAELLAQDSWSEIYFKSAKSSLIYHMVEKEKNVKSLVSESLHSYFTHTDHNYNKKLIKDITNVNISDMARIGTEYMAQLFDPTLARIAIVCHGSKCLKVAEEFRSFGFNIDVYETLDDSFLNPGSRINSNEL